MDAQVKLQSLGVIAGRFQEPDLRQHPGHIFTIEHALKRHREVLILIGVYEEAPPNERNPLSYQSRVWSIQSAFPRAALHFAPLPAHRGPYRYRSAQVDAVIQKEFPGRTAVIYGSRDSIFETYTGAFPKEFVPHVYAGNATKLRKNVVETNSPDFRKGVIWSIYNRPPVTYPTVDVVITHANLGRVVLIRKPGEEGFRFPGKFFNPKLDANYEATAERTVQTELPTLEVQAPQILASQRIEDWRYQKTRDGILTLLVRTPYSKGEPTPGEGIEEARWFDFDQIKPELFVPEHRVLAEIMQHRWHY